MKKLLSVIFAILSLSLLTSFDAYASEVQIGYDLSGIYDSLSDEVKQSLESIGALNADPQALSSLDFNSILEEIVSLAGQNAASPLGALISVISLLLLCSLVSAYKTSLSCNITSSLNTACALCVTCAVTIPAVKVIGATADVITIASNLMMAYIPVMVVIMAAAGQPISSASYYAMVLAAGEGVGQLSSRLIVPLLNMFLGFSVTSSVSADINLSGFINIISKSVKWLLGFAMTVFTAVLTFKQLITTSLDDVSTRAIRFTLNSFIPIVGSALSDAYKTVQGSVGLLKSGVGIFVIISIAFIFLPVILQSLMWLVTLWTGKAVAEVLGLRQSAGLLENISVVFSTLLAVVLCIMSIYIISTAVVILTGGGAV